jgi:glycosyltransferase involved in cell wall biosynthesis
LKDRGVILEKKIKILTISDTPLSPSGVANQTKNMIEGLLKTGKYQFVSISGAIKHREYKPIKTEEWGDDWVMYPVDGYGNANIVRDFLRNFKPDVLWFMTDPRFWGWLWAIDNEIRKNVSLVYYHVWDHYPAPHYNKPFYDSNDCIATISKLTDNIVAEVSPDVRRVHIPHAIDTETFKKLPEEEIAQFKKQSFQQSNREFDKDKFILFWNNRNARRKMSGTLIFWFKEFLDKVGHDKATFIMHTDPKDPNGQDLKAIVEHLGLTNGQVLFSTEKIPGQALARVYNMADCVVNIANAEGWGLCLEPKTQISTLEGSKTLKEIDVGDKVLTYDGTYQDVTGKCSSKKGEVYEISSLYNPKITCSSEHPFYVYDKEDKERKWMRADELDVEKHMLSIVKRRDFVDIEKEKGFKVSKGCLEIDLVEFLNLQEMEGADYDEKQISFAMGFSGNKDGLSISDIQSKYDVNKFVAENAKRNVLGLPLQRDRYYKNQEINSLSLKMVEEKVTLNNAKVTVNRFIPVDEEMLYVLGWYLAEGSNGGGDGVEFSLHKKEIGVARKIENYMLKTFGVFGVSEVIGDKNKSRYRNSSRIVSMFFEKMCGKYSNFKKINKSLYCSKINLAPMIKGLFMGDGSDSTNAYKLTTTSSQMAWQVRNILLDNNILSSVKKYPAEESNHKNRYIVSLMGENHDKFCDYLKINNEYVPSRKRAVNTFQEGNYFHVPIKKIIKRKEDRELVDIQVKNSKSFVANGVVVHNSTTEALACETPIIVNMTGGLQEQVTDGENWFGLGLHPVATPVIGSQDIPYIYEEYVSKEDFLDALEMLYNASKEERAEMGRLGREHVLKNFNIEKYIKQWDDLFNKLIEENGSWETRKNYQSWKVEEV